MYPKKIFGTSKFSEYIIVIYEILLKKKSGIQLLAVELLHFLSLQCDCMLAVPHFFNFLFFYGISSDYLIYFKHLFSQ